MIKEHNSMDHTSLCTASYAYSAVNHSLSLSGIFPHRLTSEQHLPLAHTPFPILPPPHVPTSPFAVVASVETAWLLFDEAAAVATVVVVAATAGIATSEIGLGVGLGVIGVEIGEVVGGKVDPSQCSGVIPHRPHYNINERYTGLLE